MICTIRDARRIITEAYGPDFKFRICKSCNIGVRPTYQTNVGMYMLAWAKTHEGKDSTVRIGRVSSGGAIDWQWSPQSGK